MAPVSTAIAASRRVLLIAACIAVRTDAVRLDSSAFGAVSSLVEPAGGANAPGQARQAPPNVGVADRERDLRTLAQLVDGVDVKAPVSLANAEDLIAHLDRLRGEVLNIGTFRDSRLRDKVRGLLRDIRTKTEFLNRMTGAKVLDAQAGDDHTIPSQRENICTDIDTYPEVDPRFVNDLKELCQALDAVRAVVLAGEDETPAVFEVSGRLNSIRATKDYANPHIEWRIATLLAEEYQWVTDQLARPSVAGGAADANTPELEDIHSRAGGLNAWLTDVAAASPFDPEVWEHRLHNVLEVLDSVNLEQELSLSAVRTHIQRVALCKDMIAEFITSSDPAFRERIRDVFRLIKEKTDALEALAAEREAAGDVDEVGDLLPSQRNNICKHFDKEDIEEVWRQELRHGCDSLDKLRKTAMADEDVEAVLMEVIGRLNAMRAKPGYESMPFAGALESVFAEEYRWLEANAAAKAETQA